jgi:hypothetical protein
MEGLIMKWYHYIASFFAGAFITNFIPHFINGISGNYFPTPFSNPPGKGLSSPLINIFWALFNLLIGYLLFKGGKITRTNKWGIILFLIAAVAMSINLSITFAERLH